MNDFTWDDKTAIAAVRAAAPKAGVEAGNQLLDRSNQHVPVDQGELRDSGAVTQTDDGAIISYNTPYAVKQHEDIALRHPHGGQAKFLEQVIHSEGDIFLQALADALDRALR